MFFCYSWNFSQFLKSIRHKNDENHTGAQSTLCEALRSLAGCLSGDLQLQVALDPGRGPPGGRSPALAWQPCPARPGRAEPQTTAPLAPGPCSPGPQGRILSGAGRGGGWPRHTGSCGPVARPFPGTELRVL